MCAVLIYIPTELEFPCKIMLASDHNNYNDYVNCSFAFRLTCLCDFLDRSVYICSLVSQTFSLFSLHQQGKREGFSLSDQMLLLPLNSYVHLDVPIMYMYKKLCFFPLSGRGDCARLSYLLALCPAEGLQWCGVSTSIVYWILINHSIHNIPSQLCIVIIPLSPTPTPFKISQENLLHNYSSLPPSPSLSLSLSPFLSIPLSFLPPSHSLYSKEKPISVTNGLGESGQWRVASCLPTRLSISGMWGAIILRSADQQTVFHVRAHTHVPSPCTTVVLPLTQPCVGGALIGYSMWSVK